MAGPVASNAPRKRRPVKVQIYGREYGVVTDADEGWMQDVASKVDDAMVHVRDVTETVDSLDVAVLTALNLARELMILKDQGVLPPGSDPAQHRADALRLREILQLAEGALQSPSKS
jgi:cell division protein ZapA (FtsZ GTPase activity inhibitor)